MYKEQLQRLINNADYKELESYIQAEILKAERKAIESIHSGVIDLESANRAKFYREVLDIPNNKLTSMKMNEKKTAL